MKLQEKEVKELREYYRRCLNINPDKIITYIDRKFKGYNTLGYCSKISSCSGKDISYCIQIDMVARKYPLIYEYILIHELTHTQKMKHTKLFDILFRTNCKKVGIDFEKASKYFQILVDTRYCKYGINNYKKELKNPHDEIATRLMNSQIAKLKRNRKKYLRKLIKLTREVKECLK